jgi:hypothetical protein
MPQAASTGSAAALGVILEVRRVQEQVVQVQVVEPALLPALELLLELGAHPRDRGVAQRGLHIAHRQAADEPGDHERLKGMSLGNPGAEQLGGEPLGGPA